MHFFRLLLAILASLAVATAASLPRPTTPPPPPQNLKVTAFADSGVNNENQADARDGIRLFHSKLPDDHPSRHAASARLVNLHKSGNMHVELFGHPEVQEPSTSLGEVLVHGESPSDKSLRLHPQFNKNVKLEGKRIVMGKVMDLHQHHGLAGYAKSAKVISHGPNTQSLVSFYDHLDPTPEHHISTHLIPAEVKPVQTVRWPEWGNKQ